MVFLYGLIALLALVAIISYGCFRMAFYVPRKRPLPKEEYPIPEGEIYEPFRDMMVNWIKEVRQIPCEAVRIRSFDGLTLTGKLYEYAPDAPIELMFHGYRGNAERDLCGGVQRCFALGRSVLLVDQRCCGDSDGTVITFGIHESKDCHSWLEFLLERFGPDRKIILTGISMGAATVVMAAGKPLPENVIGVLADCGYSSPKAIIQDVIRQMKLSPSLCYPFVKLAARVYGNFDLEEDSPLEAVTRANVPIIFYHGEDDAFVPCRMSKTVFDACPSRKQFVTVPGAGHGLAYPVDQERYLRTLREFFSPEASSSHSRTS